MNRKAALSLVLLIVLLLLAFGCAQRLQAAKAVKEKALKAATALPEGDLVIQLQDAFHGAPNCTVADFKAKTSLLAKAAEEAGLELPSDEASIQTFLQTTTACKPEYVAKVFKGRGKGVYEIRVSFNVAAGCTDESLKSFVIDNFLVIEVNTGEEKAKVTHGAFDEAALQDLPQVKAAIALAGNCTAPLMLASGLLENAVGDEEATVDQTLPEVPEESPLTEEQLEEELEQQVEQPPADLCAGKVCDDKNPCTTDKCESATGNCASEKMSEGTQCSATGKCDGLGKCVEAVEGPCKNAVCDDKNPCSENKCNPQTVTCYFPPLPESTPCGTNGKCDGQGRCNEPCVPPCFEGFKCVNRECRMKNCAELGGKFCAKNEYCKGKFIRSAENQTGRNPDMCCENSACMPAKAVAEKSGKILDNSNIGRGQYYTYFNLANQRYVQNSLDPAADLSVSWRADKVSISIMEPKRNKVKIANESTPSRPWEQIGFTDCLNHKGYEYGGVGIDQDSPYRTACLQTDTGLVVKLGKMSVAEHTIDYVIWYVGNAETSEPVSLQEPQLRPDAGCTDYDRDEADKMYIASKCVDSKGTFTDICTADAPPDNDRTIYGDPTVNEYYCKAASDSPTQKVCMVVKEICHYGCKSGRCMVRAENPDACDPACEKFEKCIKNKCVWKTCVELGGKICAADEQCATYLTSSYEEFQKRPMEKVCCKDAKCEKKLPANMRKGTIKADAFLGNANKLFDYDFSAGQIIAHDSSVADPNVDLVFKFDRLQKAWLIFVPMWKDGKSILVRTYKPYDSIDSANCLLTEYKVKETHVGKGNIFCFQTEDGWIGKAIVTSLDSFSSVIEYIMTKKS